ncbi:MAG: Helix-turn-helix domain [Pseudomonadota bacterium]|jgi:excisionase family DNA binding protein
MARTFTRGQTGWCWRIPIEGRARGRHLWVVPGAVEEFLFLEEVARHARVSVDSVRHWIKSGRLRSVRPGKRRLVLRRDLEAFLQRNERGAHQETSK